jgi:hypothetical protein
MDFLNLPVEKLKNKVVCDLHFSENHFMNYNRNKLNKTTAIPTIYINPKNEEVDLLVKPEEWVVANRAMEVPTQYKNTPVTKIDMDESVSDLQQLPALKKLKREAPSSSPQSSPSPQQKMRILNKVPTPLAATAVNTFSANKSITIKQIKTESPQSSRTLQNPKLPSIRMQKVVASTPHKPKVIENQSTSASSFSPEFSFAENNDEQETFEYVTVVQSEEQGSSFSKNMSSPPAPPRQVIPEDIKDLITRTSDGIDELKTIVASSFSRMPTPIKEEFSNITHSSYNKVQLFNGIKRYLPPSLMALVRMELFGAPNREYRKDERIICGELLKLGEQTYDFFSEEWRLRLPSKDQVQTWLSEETPVDDDDAC